MYLKNLRNITETLPENNNIRFDLFSYSYNILHYVYQGSRSIITAFLLLITVFLFAGCESPGIIGEDIISDGENIEVIQDTVEHLTVLEENSYSGRLPNTALGYVEDPVFGTIHSIALLKPSISRTNLDTLYSDDKIHLKLIFNSEIYGNRQAVSDYEIYEVGELWRGNQLRFNKEISVNYSNKIAEFQVSDEDTVWVEMSPNWTQKFAEFFNDTTAMRDSLYRNQFPGIAIVPSKNNEKVRFLKNLTTGDEEDDNITTFVVETQHLENEEENDNGNNEENDNGDNGENDENGEEDNGLRELGMRDWGASFVRSGTEHSDQGIVFHSFETVVQVELDLPVETLKTKNISNAKLFLNMEDLSPLTNPDFVRPQTNSIFVYVFSEVPRDIQAEIFTTNTPFSVQKDDDDDFFEINITEYLLNEVFGDSDERKLFLTFLSPQASNGILYSVKFHSLDGPDNKKPRIVITSVK